MSTQFELYGEHADLLEDCYITVYSDGRTERYMTVVHRPSGTTVKVSGISDIMMKRDALNQIAGLLT